MGESSFNSTKSIELISESYGENIQVLFASNTDSKYIVVKRQIVLENSFAGKLIIYLNNGDVISLLEPFATDYTNRTVTGMYVLTNQVVDKLIEQVEKTKNDQNKIDGQVILDVLTVNGVRFSFEDGSWGLIRASSNKPSLVVVIESPTSESRKKKIFNFIDGLLQKTGKVGEYDQKI